MKRQETRAETVPALPAWLSRLENTPAEDDNELIAHDVAEENSGQAKSDVERNIYNLRQEIHNARSPRFLNGSYILCLSHLKQDLALGLVSGETLKSVLQDVTKDFHDASSRWMVSVDQTLALFYASVWEGLSACKVFRPTDVDGEVLNSFLSLIACLPFTEKVQDLASSILLSTSAHQHLKMEAGIVTVVDCWSQSWLPQGYVRDLQFSVGAAELAVTEVRLNLDILHEHIVTLQNGSESGGMVSRILDVLSCTKYAIHVARNAIMHVEDTLWPRKLSAKKLANALDSLPFVLLSRIIPVCSDNIDRAYLKHESGTLYHQTLSNRKLVTRESNKLHYRWLSTLSKMSKVGDKLFFHVWKEFYVDKFFFSEAGCCNLILDHWISQGLVTKTQEVGIQYGVSKRQDFASLLFAIEKYKQNYWTRTRDLFLILNTLGRYKKLYQVLSRMKSLGMKLPWQILRMAVEIISGYDNRFALRTYNLSHSLDDGVRPIRISFLQTFVITLINDPNINPTRIWAMLNIPIYARLPPSRRCPQSQRLSPAMVKMINAMALEFARCEFRSKRVALRHVMNCLHHLSIHKARVTSELSKALAHIGITREMQDCRFVGQERLHYIISMIEKIEGRDVAERVDGIVFDWRSYFTEKAARERREGNVLRAGPID